MKTLTEFAFTTARGGKSSSYDWDVLFDGQIRKLEAGVDLTGKARSFMTGARKAAKKRGLDIRMNKVGEDVVLQAIVAAPAKPDRKPSRKSAAK